MMEISEVTAHLYICGASAVQRDAIYRLGINCIVNCTTEIPNLEMKGVECLKLPIEDAMTSQLGVHFDLVADKVHETHQNGGKTIIHCMAGASRSATLCLAYLMKHRGKTLKQAYDHLKKRRRIVRPNLAFWRQLVDYEKRIFGKNSIEMVSSDIGFVPDIYKVQRNDW